MHALNRGVNRWQKNGCLNRKARSAAKPRLVTAPRRPHHSFDVPPKLSYPTTPNPASKLPPPNLQNGGWPPQSPRFVRPPIAPSMATITNPLTAIHMDPALIKWNSTPPSLPPSLPACLPSNPSSANRIRRISICGWGEYVG